MAGGSALTATLSTLEAGPHTAAARSQVAPTSLQMCCTGLWLSRCCARRWRRGGAAMRCRRRPCAMSRISLTYNNLLIDVDVLNWIDSCEFQHPKEALMQARA